MAASGSPMMALSVISKHDIGRGSTPCSANRAASPDRPALAIAEIADRKIDRHPNFHAAPPPIGRLGDHAGRQHPLSQTTDIAGFFRQRKIKLSGGTKPRTGWVQRTRPFGAGDQIGGQIDLGLAVQIEPADVSNASRRSRISDSRSDRCGSVVRVIDHDTVFASHARRRAGLYRRAAAASPASRAMFRCQRDAHGGGNIDRDMSPSRNSSANGIDQRLRHD